VRVNFVVTPSKSLAAIFSAVLLAIVSLPASAEDSTQWRTVLSSQDNKDTPVYYIEDALDGADYKATLYGRDFVGVPDWNEGKELPIPIEKIRDLALSAFTKEYPQFAKFKLVSINLMRLSIFDKWIVQVDFDGTDYSGEKAILHRKAMRVLILLNGRVIVPSKTVK
jgi:hypothetical protein